ncbi:hypothetical protein N7471_012736 [Penicillium samsonianum]|uniref:uncharacterized protein n=1 Tax=Penicillium samsonianum TaxID=1882272 RepID=UPI0025499681|nr:uncharacterized protein N7471_012736 [Penicillium samsonianum]KAJ6125419.1 hypothetical protein N7471_012736 [Penicillium samsonianum]
MHDDKYSRKCHPSRRLLVSQDNREIFLPLPTTIISISRTEKTGTHRTPGSNGPLLKMQTYRPNIAHPTHMENLARFILCVAFEVTYE